MGTNICALTWVSGPTEFMVLWSLELHDQQNIKSLPNPISIFYKIQREDKKSFEKGKKNKTTTKQQ